MTTVKNLTLLINVVKFTDHVRTLFAQLGRQSQTLTPLANMFTQLALRLQHKENEGLVKALDRIKTNLDPTDTDLFMLNISEDHSSINLLSGASRFVGRHFSTQARNADEWLLFAPALRAAFTLPRGRGRQGQPAVCGRNAAAAQLDYAGRADDARVDRVGPRGLPGGEAAAPHAHDDNGAHTAVAAHWPHRSSPHGDAGARVRRSPLPIVRWMER